MSITSLPSLIKQIYRYTRTSNSSNFKSLLHLYKGNDWLEHMRHNPYANVSLVIPLYTSEHLSLQLIGLDNQSKFFFHHRKRYHIKVLDGKLKALPSCCVIGSNPETIDDFFNNGNDDEKAWLENHFTNHSSALVISHKTL